MPAKRLPWFKLWPEAVDHEKIAQLGDPEFRTWITVLARAADQPTRWRFASLKHAATAAGRPLRQVKTLVSARLLDDCGGEGVWIHDWKQWQERYASDFLDSDDTPPTLPEHSPNGSPNSPSTLRDDSPQRSDKKRELRRESTESRPVDVDVEHRRVSDVAVVAPGGSGRERGGSSDGFRPLGSLLPRRRTAATAAAIDSVELPAEVLERLSRPPIGGA